jgi:predicted metalloprotease with PDZ domain
VALQGLRVTARQIEARLERLGVGATVRLHYFRRDELREALVQARAAQPDTCELRYSRGASPGALRRWLGSPKDARAGVDRGRVRP